MTTKQKENNNQTLEDIKLNDPRFKTFAVRTKSDKDADILARVEMDVGGVVVGRIIRGEPVHLVSRNIVLALRKYNETHQDKVDYEVF